MIVRVGTAVTIPVLFSDGEPDGDVSYTLRDPSGVVFSGTATPAADAVSINLTIAGNLNGLAPGAVLSYRDLEWSYTVGGAARYGEQRYSVEARLPFGVSNDGVRVKLGAEPIDLPDSHISLARAYLNFQKVVGVAALAAHDPQDLAVTDAIEALAALSLIPTMAARLATRESSGTNQFQRQEINWGEVATVLEGQVSAGYLAIDPTYSETTAFGSLLIVVTPATDAITGATA